MSYRPRFLHRAWAFLRGYSWIPCPICKKDVRPDAPFAPFCCERCKLVDLGRWFKGDYVVAGEDAVELDPEQFEEGLRRLAERAAEEAAEAEGESEREGDDPGTEA